MISGKVLKLCLAAVYAMTNVLLVHAEDRNYWNERRRSLNSKSTSTRIFAAGNFSTSSTNNLIPTLPDLHGSLAPNIETRVVKGLPEEFLERNKSLLTALPPSAGSIRKVTLPTFPSTAPQRVVVHIQDVHHNDDAQKNIEKTLLSLLEKNQAPLVALEGTFGPINLAGIRSFSRQDVVRKWADFMLDGHKVSGPIHGALTSVKAFPSIVGIDDATHYNANVEAYRASAPKISLTKSKLNEIREGIGRRKASLFNVDLIDFDRRVQAYHDGISSLGEHIKNLSSHVATDQLTPVVKDFLSALDQESALNFQQVESERIHLVGALVQQLDHAQTDELMQKSLAYRAGQLRYADFYRSLQFLCERNGVSLTKFPAMAAYIKYVLEADRIDPERMMEEMTVLEKTAYDGLAKKSEEKELVAESRRLTLAKKLVDFSLVPEEYKEFTQSDFSTLNLDITSFKAFYEEAQARDKAMAENLLKAMDDRKTEMAVIVTGGFHERGMTEHLKKVGVAVVSFTPRIEKIDSAHGSSYLSVFTQEKTPIERMFQGRTLFLATDPAAGFNTAGLDLAAGATVNRQIGENLGLAGLKTELNKFLSELRDEGLLPDGVTAPEVQFERKGDKYEVTIEVHYSESEVRRVKYTVVFNQEGNYFEAESAALSGPLGVFGDALKPLAERYSRRAIEFFNSYFEAGFPSAISEMPLLKGLESMGLGAMLRFVGLHENLTLQGIVWRLARLEMLRRLTGLDLSPLDGILAHHLLSTRPDGSLRTGALSITRAISVAEQVFSGFDLNFLNERLINLVNSGIRLVDVKFLLDDDVSRRLTKIIRRLQKANLAELSGELSVSQAELERIRTVGTNFIEEYFFGDILKLQGALSELGRDTVIDLIGLHDIELILNQWTSKIVTPFNESLRSQVLVSELGISMEAAERLLDDTLFELNLAVVTQAVKSPKSEMEFWKGRIKDLSFDRKIKFLKTLYEDVLIKLQQGMWTINGEEVQNETKVNAWQNFYSQRVRDIDLLINGLLPTNETCGEWMGKFMAKISEMTERGDNDAKDMQSLYDKLPAGDNESSAQSYILEYLAFDDFVDRYLSARRTFISKDESERRNQVWDLPPVDDPASFVTNTWSLSYWIGYGIVMAPLLTVVGVGMALFGIDLSQFLEPLKVFSILTGLAMAVPITMHITSTQGIAHWIEDNAMVSNPDVWALKHSGVERGSEKYRLLLNNSKMIIEAGNIVKAQGGDEKTQRNARRQAHNALNRQSYKRKYNVIATEIMKLMPSARKGEYSVGEALEMALMTPPGGSQVDSTEGLGEVLRPFFDNNLTEAEVQRQLSYILFSGWGEETKTVQTVFVPLPAGLVNDSGPTNNLSNYVEGAFLRHSKDSLVFVTEREEVIPAIKTISNKYPGKPYRVEKLPGLFFQDVDSSAKILKLSALESLIPNNASSAIVYVPETFKVDYPNEGSLLSESKNPTRSISELEVFVKRFLELARYLAVQA